jgi:hypothetical protein
VLLKFYVSNLKPAVFTGIWSIQIFSFSGMTTVLSSLVSSSVAREKAATEELA